MGEYQRTTRECSMDSMSPLLSSAIRDHIERYELNEVYDSILICCETTSTKEKKQFFRRKTVVERIGLVLTPHWLIRAGSQNDELAGVFSGRLHDLRVEDYEKTTMYERIPDTGIIVSGFHSMSDDATLFLGFGPEKVAQNFRDLLRENMTS